MVQINLIPAPRQQAKRRQRHWRICITGCALCTVAMLLSGALIFLLLASRHEGDAQRLEALQQQIEQSTQSLNAARGELRTSKAAWDVTRKIHSQPDWSLLFALVANQTGDSVMLRSCNFSPRSSGGTVAVVPVSLAPGATPPASLAPRASLERLLNLSGAGESQAAVSDFILRLEKTGLFSRVTALDTHRDRAMGSEVVAFRIECALEANTK